MKDWLLEGIDQIALGEVLAGSTISCGQRFGLIAVDNAVEFMLISYVEVHRQLVGGHKAGGITKKDWAETKDKFPKLLSLVVNLEPKLAALEAEIGRYHDFRNGLYHTGAPTTTSPQRVRKYSNLALKVLDTLFSIKLSATEWSDTLAAISTALSGGKTQPSVRREVAFEEANGIVKFNCGDTPNAKNAIALALHGFSFLKATPPDRKQLAKAMAMSGHPLSPSVIKARITDLRNSGWIQKNELIVTAKGRKQLRKSYIL